VGIDTWNVGALTGKSRKLSEVLKRRKVNICCVQESGKERKQKK
jgi:exonuclease III